MQDEFGPNQGAVDAMLERLERVTHEMAMFLGTFDTDTPDRRAAREAMRQAALDSGREKPLRAAQREVEAWVDHWFAGGPGISGYTRNITPAEAAARAAPLVLDAVGATVVKDRLPERDSEVLMAPWQALWTQDAV